MNSYSMNFAYSLKALSVGSSLFGVHHHRKKKNAAVKTVLKTARGRFGDKISLTIYSHSNLLTLANFPHLNNGFK
jgi:hypothetical protein